MEHERDYIGPDPLKWINRLMDVNEGSQFSPEQKATIASGLMRLLQELERSGKR